MTTLKKIPEPLESELSNLVRQALKEYFDRLDGHLVSDLHALVLHEVEQPLIRTVLEHCAHNQTKAAQILGWSRSTLRKKMGQYGIE